MLSSQVNGYSSIVDMHLVVGEESLRVGQVGRDSLILREARELPPTDHAVLLIRVDNHQSTYYVSLPHGASVESKTVVLGISSIPALNSSGFVGVTTVS